MLTTLLAIAALADPFLPLDDTHRWGFKKGIQVAIHPVAIRGGGDGGPRGLLRIGYPILPDGKVSLINFIAVEPVVRGHRGYSELERSADGKPGKLITLTGTGRALREGEDTLRVSLEMERFENGSKVRLELRFRSTQPDEVELRAFAAAGSAAMEECALTATMGNYERLRRIKLNGRVLESGAVFKDFLPNGFTQDHLVPAAELPRTPGGDLLVSAATDEADPRILQESLPKSFWWRYPGAVVTQYWRAPKGTFSPAIKLRLNGRKTYYGTRAAIPGGVAFENFELRDTFRSGQPFIFGVTRKSPIELLKWAPANPFPPDRN